MDENLVRKYNTPGPRYTSYPTVPYWDTELFSVKNWKDSVKNAFWISGKEISIYIHLPFCESLCTYCGCNTRITKNHDVEGKYIAAVLAEWQMYLATFPSKPIIKELHLGGGTPTFFSPENLQKLIRGILAFGIVPKDHEYAFEGHPNNTTKDHLQTLYDLGFTRVSFGIQDFDEEVQKLINRIQPFEKVQEVVKNAREIGYKSINFDLIYGLPKQTKATVASTIKKTIELKPDRIAFYSYAHVPHLKPAQKSFEQWLPQDDEKRALYELGKAKLTENGYFDIGMDHFAVAKDAMYLAHLDGSLHRNFMGYSLQHTQEVIGLGVSAISDTWTSFAQNVKSVEAYYEKIDQGQLPLLKGHHLTQQDITVRKKILDLICRYETSWSEAELQSFGLDINFESLDELIADGLIEINDFGLKVSEKGRPFIRNVCMPLDARMWRDKDKKVTFSKTV
jgi:oxygen-independent coproporphyrinogen III oxidase